MTIQQRQRLLNDAIVVYKRNFKNEVNNVGFDQADLANLIGGVAKRVQREFIPNGRYFGGLTSITLQSKMNF
jgi:hypothetical protein